MSNALIIGIIGGMLGDMNKIMILALGTSLLSVITYFLISKGILFKIFLIASLLLMLLSFFKKKRNRTDNDLKIE